MERLTRHLSYNRQQRSFFRRAQGQYEHVLLYMKLRIIFPLSHRFLRKLLMSMVDKKCFGNPKHTMVEFPENCICTCFNRYPAPSEPAVAIVRAACRVMGHTQEMHHAGE